MERVVGQPTATTGATSAAGASPASTVKGVYALIKRKQAGRHAAGNGLYLQVKPSGTASWLYRYSANGKQVEMGLGVAKRTAEDATGLSLAEAGLKRDEAQRARNAGADPLQARLQIKAAQAALAARQKAEAAEADARDRNTFGAVAAAHIAKRRTKWKSAKHAAQWISTLKQYCTVIWLKPVADVTVKDVEKILVQPWTPPASGRKGKRAPEGKAMKGKPLWLATPVTADRLMQRIHEVFDVAIAGELRVGVNPAARSVLKHLLPGRPAKGEPGHHAALPASFVPALVARLRATASVSALALEFTILTAARTSEVREAHWAEFDLEATGGPLWIVPAARMKMNRSYMVPLSKRAAEIVGVMQTTALPGDNFVFPTSRLGEGGRRLDRALSNAAMAELLKDMLADVAMPHATVHGMRATFRTWAEDNTSFQPAVLESALAHVERHAVVASYQRSTHLEQRRKLMQLWADHCSSLPKDVGDNVVSIRANA